MSTEGWRDSTPGPFTADGMQEGGYYELSDGHPVQLSPSKQKHGAAKMLGAVAVGTDPLAVGRTGIDVGHKLSEKTLRAPDVSVGGVLPEGGWAEGAPPLAIEYAGDGTVESDLQKKVRELLAAGSVQVWVVRLEGPRRVEVYEPGKPPRIAADRDELRVPGVLANPVPAAALYDREAAIAAGLRNLLQRAGYKGLEEVREEGKAESKAEGKAEGKAEAVLAVLAARGLAVSDAQGERIRNERDLAVLERWLARCASVASVEELLAE